MTYKLAGRNVLVTGGSRGLGAAICQKFAAEGCNIAINYANSEEPAKDLAKQLESEHKVKTAVLKGDCSVTDECHDLVKKTIESLGGVDIIIGNAGWTKFTDFNDLGAMTEAEWDKCWAIHVKGMKALLEAALPTFHSNDDGGVLLITSSVAGIHVSGSSMAYSVTKAAQLHLMKCMAQTQGPKVRVNAVLPGLLLTEWGSAYGEERIEAIKDWAVLKKDTDVGECADAFIMLAKNTSITGTELKIDAGLRIGSK